MVRWTRSTQIARGKGMQAMQWSKEITEWANKKFNLQMKVYMDNFGEIGVVRWFVDYENLAGLEKIRNSLLGDQEYWQKIDQSADFFIEGSGFDMVMSEF
jgi:hypothetical protein